MPESIATVSVALFTILFELVEYIPYFTKFFITDTSYDNGFAYSYYLGTAASGSVRWFMALIILAQTGMTPIKKDTEGFFWLFLLAMCFHFVEAIEALYEY